MTAIKSPGDQRIRDRVTTVLAQSVTSGPISVPAPQAQFCDQHYLSIVPIGTLTGGTLRLRARAVNGGSVGYITPSLESIAATGTTLHFRFFGFFDLFELSFPASVTGGSISATINSTVTG